MKHDPIDTSWTVQYQLWQDLDDFITQSRKDKSLSNLTESNKTILLKIF